MSSPYPSVALLAVVGVLCVGPGLFPGDVQWVNDEPLLLFNALEANAGARLATRGLLGNLGVIYGPFPTWLYQAYLLFSRDVVTLVALRAILVTAVTAAALLWVSRGLSLWPWFVVPLLLSPHLWFYARVVWDNTFNIPLSALAMAAFVRLLEGPSRRTAALLSFCMVAMLLTHLMSLALVAAVVAVLAALRGREMWSQRLALAAGALPLVVAGLPYWAYLAGTKPHSTVASSATAWLFPLDGPRILSAAAIENHFGSAWVTEGGALVAAARAVTLIAYPLCWVGAGFAVLEFARGLRRDRRLGPREGFSALLLMAFIGQVALDGLTGRDQHTHYFSATWLVFGGFAWLTLDRMRPSSLRAAATIVYAASLGTVMAALFSTIHSNGGSRVVYGPTLSNLLAVTEELRRYPPSTPVHSDVPNLKQYPHSLELLRRLRPPPPDAGTPPRPLCIRYRSNDPRDARVELLVEAPESAALRRFPVTCRSVVHGL